MGCMILNVKMHIVVSVNKHLYLYAIFALVILMLMGMNVKEQMCAVSAWVVYNITSYS